MTIKYLYCEKSRMKYMCVCNTIRLFARKGIKNDENIVYI